jgi:hypothetical protein
MPLRWYLRGALGVGGHPNRKRSRRLVRDIYEGKIFMAKVIEFYISATFEKRVASVPDLQRGRLIEFCFPLKKSA